MTAQYTGRDLTLLLSHARTVGLSSTISSDCDRLAFWRTLTRVLTKPPATLTPTPLGKMDYNADKRARKPPRTFRKDLLRVQWGTCLQGFRAGEAKLSEIAQTWVCFSGKSLYRSLDHGLTVLGTSPRRGRPSADLDRKTCASQPDTPDANLTLLGPDYVSIFTLLGADYVSVFT